MGPGLSERVQLITLDLRGTGRSANVEAPVDLERVLDDIEAVRLELGLDSWTVMGHSFGGSIATAYARVHPDRTRRVILVETTPDLPAALEHQVQFLVARYAEEHPALRSLPDGTSLERLTTALGMVGVEEAQRVLQWSPGGDDGYARVQALDAQSGLMSCSRREAVEAYVRVLEAVDASPLPVPGVLFGGTRSETIGRSLLEQASETWQVPLRWFERSGHFPYVEETDAFVDAVATETALPVH